jgi:hypothetical protein
MWLPGFTLGCMVSKGENLWSQPSHVRNMLKGASPCIVTDLWGSFLQVRGFWRLIIAAVAEEIWNRSWREVLCSSSIEDMLFLVTSVNLSHKILSVELIHISRDCHLKWSKKCSVVDCCHQQTSRPTWNLVPDASFHKAWIFPGTRASCTCTSIIVNIPENATILIPNQNICIRFYSSRQPWRDDGVCS